MILSAETLVRAQAVCANPQSSAAEIAAVHDLLWPAQAPICPTLTCTRKLGEAWRAIARAMRQRTELQPVQSSTSAHFKPTMSKQQVRLFADPNTQYTPHNSGVSYNNKNLTPEIVASILKADPDAERLFEPLEEAEEAPSEKPLAKMTKQELIEVYTTEVGSAPNLDELKTNPLLVTAIEAHRAAQQK